MTTLRFRFRCVYCSVMIAVAAGVVLVATLASTFADQPAATATRKGFRFAEIDTESLGLWDNDRAVLVYNHGIKRRRDVPQDRWRSTYVHPLYGLDGEVLTDDFPRDHYHHRGLFWAWPHVVVDGVDYDLWMLRGVQQRFERWQEQTANEDKAVLAVENGWYVGEKRIVKEEVRFSISAASHDERTIDVRLTLTALDLPVTLVGAEGKGYGGLSLRFAPRKETAIATEYGPQKDDANLTRLAWADLSAVFKGTKQPSGVAIVVGSGHGKQPPRWITRGYGFLGVGWPEAPNATLTRGAPIAMAYRLVVHRGAVDAERLKGMRDELRKEDAAAE